MEGFHLPQKQISLRSSHQRCSERKGVLSNFEKFTGKHLCQSLFFNEVAGFRLWKERPWYRCFHVNFVKFRRTFFYRTTLRDCFYHYEKTEPFTTNYLSHQALSSWRKSYSELNLGKRCSVLFMFSRLHFKFWKINILHFLEKTQIKHN